MAEEIPEGYEPLPSAKPEGYELLPPAGMPPFPKPSKDDLPPGYEPLPRTRHFEPSDEEIERHFKKRSLIDRIAQRFLGTDVDDPVEMPRLGATVVGGFAGSYLGSRTPSTSIFVNPVTGAMAGGVAGSLTGAVAPEIVMGAAASAGLIDEETRARYSLSFEDLRTLAEGEALLEVATGGGLAALRLAGRGTARLLTGSGKKGAEAAERAARQGIELMPVQVGGRTIGRGYVAVMGRFPWFGGPLRKTGQAAESALETKLLAVPERVGPLSNWSDVSERIFDDARDLVGRTGNYFNGKYAALWARADEAGVKVIPQETLTKADEILAKIAKQTPAHVTGPGAQPGVALQRIKSFIETQILPMRAMVASPIADLSGRPIREEMRMASQSLRQMDGLVSKIDQELASLEPGQKRFAQALFGQLRQAAQADSLVNLRGADAAEIGRAMRELDSEFSYTMSQLFETATAKQFQSVRRRGIRGIAADETTRMPVDQLARVIVKLDSPQALDELSRIVTPDTFSRITAHVMDDAVSAAMTARGAGATGAGRTFDVDTFARRLGLDKPGGDRRQVVASMLEKSGSPLTISDVEDLVVAARAISDAEIPNVSSFIARRATIGGLQSVINGVIPGAAIMSGTAYAGGTLLSTAMMLGGGRLVSAILAKPESARALKTVLDKEASQLVKREAWIRALRVAIVALGDEETTPGRQPRFTFRNDMLDRVVNLLDAEVRAMMGEEAE